MHSLRIANMTRELIHAGVQICKRRARCRALARKSLICDYSEDYAAFAAELFLAVLRSAGGWEVRQKLGGPGFIGFFFFFQAEDGIRDLIVTGVQTCALPI